MDLRIDVTPGPQTPSLTSWRVLVIDDNVDAADSLATFLELVGHEVTTAYTGATGLKAAEALSPEVVVLDIGLPGMDGYEVARRLRSGPAGSALRRLVALTGYGQPADRDRALAA